MIVPEACDCMYTNNPATIYVRTNAQSYRIVEVYPYMSNMVAKLMSCHVDCLRRIRIADYDNY